MIKNPVLTGFHPDPSMICVDGVFYIANSTFEYFPGVRISASTDLANFSCVSTPLDNKEYLNMTGNIASGGIWAPCLSYDNGLFYLVFTDVKAWRTAFKDCHNYITTAKDIKGPWSKPVYMNSIGFDASLFHDDDGKKYFLNAEWDCRFHGKKNFSGILVTQIDPITFEFIGETKKIFKGSDLGMVEAPHIYKKDSWYYLFTAEGGTFYEHAITVARSRSIYGPYEVHPNTFLLRAYGNPNHPLQKTGHGSICQGSDDRWFVSYLCGRPVDEKHCILGRETAIDEIVWINDWPYLKNGSLLPSEYFQGYGSKIEKKEYNYVLGSEDFYLNFNTLRGPAKHKILENNVLALYGKESLMSVHNQSVFVRRQTDFSFEATTHLELPFNRFQQFAGLIYRYDENHQFLLKMAYDENLDKKGLGIIAIIDGKYTNPLLEEIKLPTNTIWLRLTVKKLEGYFSYSLDGANFIDIDYKINTTILSDDHCSGFTGAYVGMAAYDLYNHTSYALFKSFTYKVI